MRYFFLCDACATKWVSEAFNGRPSLWDSESVHGYCHLCNEEKPVKLRTWFMCDICFRVAGSIGRNHVAEQAILRWWREKVQAHHPHFVVEQHDVSSLRSFQNNATRESCLDFLIRDERSAQIVLGIENKTGRSSIEEMSSFQLDVSDCDSLLTQVRSRNIPCYIIHAQVLEKWKPPTVGFVLAGLWWTDIYRLSNAFQKKSRRADERRQAAYFQTSAFQPIDTFLDHLLDANGRLTLVEEYRRDGVPKLYPEV